MSDVLSGMHVRSLRYARLEAHAPWGVSYPAHSASVGMLVRGNCLLSIDDPARSIPITGGDCWLMLHGDAFSLRSDERAATRPFGDVFKRQEGTVNQDGDGPLAVIVGGWFEIDRLSGRPLTRLLPPLIHIPTGQAHLLALHTTFHQLANETATSAPGSQVVVNRLAELLFIQVIRAHIAARFADETGWLGALNDRSIGEALHLMHNRLEHPWTVQSLANEIGMSRSAFAHRFRRLVGEGPLEYLTNWRIYKSSELLRGGDMKLSAVAQAVGYESDIAFGRVFKRIMKMSPGRYREARRAD